jgi:phage shock protein A
MASGALDDVTGTPRDDIQAELDSMRSGPDIELELQRLRGELGTGSTQAIEGGAAGSDGAATSDGAAASDGAARPAAAEQPQAGDGT